jgi:O-antigen ligase
VTSAAAPGPRLTLVEAARRPRLDRRARWMEMAAFAGSVFLLLTYSQGWEAPLVGNGAESSDSVLLRIGFLPAYAVGVALVALTPLAVARALVRQPCLIAVILIAALSMFWSVAPDQTSRRVFALAFTTLGAVALAARYSWARLAEVMATTFAILAVLSLGVCLFAPSIGRMQDIFPGAWRGLWHEKNTLGGNMAQGFVICAAAALLNPKRARLWWAAAALALALVVMSTSKTALVSMLLGVGALVLIRLVRQGPAMGVAATWMAVAAVGAIACLGLFASNVLFSLLGKDATLTGRTELWAAIMRQIQERPWQGYGYGAIWDETDNWGPLAWITHDAGFKAREAHNTWLEQWLGTGVIGLSAWMAFYLQTLCANIVAVYRQKGAYLALPFFLVISLTTLTESIAVLYNDLRWVIFVALAVKLALPERPPER